MKLSLGDIEFDSGSVVDDAGIVFHYDNRVFRAINNKYVAEYSDLIRSNKLVQVFEEGLVNTWISEIELEGYELVLEHKCISTLSSWKEWSSQMIKEATLVIAKVAFELSKLGYTLKDTQPGNVQFENGQAIWIDFGSIKKIETDEAFRFGEFRFNNLLPLWLYCRGYHKLGRKIYDEIGKDYLKQLSEKLFFKLFPFKYALIVKSSASLTVKLERVIKLIESLSIKEQKGSWSAYQQGGRPDVNDVESFGEKPKAIISALKLIRPGTLLDVAGNKGWYSELAVKMGFRATCFDLDDTSINQLYNRVRSNNLPILPLVVDVLRPTSPYSIALGKSDSFARLKSDTVMALAILHHLVFFSKIRFDTFSSIISQYSQKYAIIEFIPEDDQYVSKWINDDYHWYNLENLKIALGKHFHQIVVRNSHPLPRKLLICYKK